MDRTTYSRGITIDGLINMHCYLNSKFLPGAASHFALPLSIPSNGM